MDIKEKLLKDTKEKILKRCLSVVELLESGALDDSHDAELLEDDLVEALKLVRQYIIYTA